MIDIAEEGYENPFLPELREECGIFGIYNAADAVAHTVLGLHALQHRGQEGAGIVTVDEREFFMHYGDGHVGDIFADKNNELLKSLSGTQAVGHVRYSTAGSKYSKNYQPLYAEFSFGKLALAHNGNLTNPETLRKRLISEGAIFTTTMDTEVIIHLMARSRALTASERLIEAALQVKGAFSILAMSEDSLIAMRDANGVRPLALGKLKDSYVVASESCAFDIIGASFIRDIKPGEMVIIDSKGVQSLFPFGAKVEPKFCIFEYIYFSRPDSKIEGRNVYNVRKSIGRELAKESGGLVADVVVPVPDSGVAAAIGYAEESNIPFELGIIRNHYVGRTFIEPTDTVRNLGVKLKHNANLAVLKGKSVILIDDSIVRGTTSKKIVDMVRHAGAKEVHLRISSPPTTHSCFYGVDTPDRDKLLAANHSVEDMCQIIGADSLTFISMDGLYQAVARGNRAENRNYCDACFSGEYPIELEDNEQEGISIIKSTS